MNGVLQRLYAEIKFLKRELAESREALKTIRLLATGDGNWVVTLRDIRRACDRLVYVDTSSREAIDAALERGEG